MSQLLDGVRTFQTLEFPTLRKQYDRLRDRQNPKALFITCSDSRIEPGRLTQTSPGELIVIRNAGNIVPTATEVDGVLATIEFAINGLKVPEVIVCGHSHCLAMMALIDENYGDHLSTMKTWFGRQGVQPDVACCEDSAKAVWRTAVQNVHLQLMRLREIPFVASALAANRLTLSGWCYQFETGDLFVVDEATGDAQPIAHPGSDATRSRPSSAAFRGIYRGGL